MNKTAKPSAPYTRRPPSPPQLHVPGLHKMQRTGNRAEFVMVPSYDNVDPSQLTTDDLAIITRNETQLVAPNTAGSWLYEQRRMAQRILDFLYIGPMSVIRDHAFLKSEGITMVIVARDSRLASRGMRSVDDASKALGITSEYFDVGSNQDLIHGFPGTIRSINNHLLSVYHSQIQGRDESGQLLLDPTGFQRGKVLVTCESGNELSPAIVAAYIMSVFGKDMANALQFVSVQRFCVSFSEDMKRLLQSWGDILRARASVARAAAPAAAPGYEASPGGKSKRRVDDLRDEDDEMELMSMDEERFEGRAAFVPFVDLPESGR